jgi:glycogen debranching enzyme
MKKSYLLFIFALILSFFFGCTEEEVSPIGRVTFKDLKVEFSDYPYYIEDAVTGGPISDFGSHYGIKANLTDNKFMKLAYYSCLTATNGMFSHSWFTFDKRLGGERKVEFKPWRIEERNEFAGARAFFIDTDMLLIDCKLKEPTKIRFHLSRDNSTTEEGLSPDYTCVLYPIEKFGNLALDKSIIKPKQSAENENVIFRGFYPTFDFLISNNSLISIQEIDRFQISVGFSNNKNNALNLAKKGHEKLSIEGVDKLNNLLVKDWNEYLNCLAPNEKRYEILLKEALTALRMNIYAPRNQMRYPCSVPSKVHYNYFWGWDTPFHALGYNYFNSSLAIENMLLQFEGLKENGLLSNTLDDSLEPAQGDIAQPPNQGWAIIEIYNKCENKGFLNQMYVDFSKYVEWFEKNRDADKDGLFEYHHVWESGMDDTPRFNPYRDVSGFNLKTFDIKGIDALDLNCWFYQDYKILGKCAKILEREREATIWERKASDLASLIENRMWSEADGCWFDLKRVNDHYEFVKVLTPIIWFPVWVGATNNETRIKRVINEHLLNPREFFGKYPIPSVAYNDKFFNKEQEGYYWRGQIWINHAYIAYDTLKKSGYKAEALELKHRLLDMMSQKGGIYENYNPLTGEVGWSWYERSYHSCFQFGWSSTFVIEMLTDELVKNAGEGI